MKNLLAVLAAVGLVVTVAVFANRPGEATEPTPEATPATLADEAATEDGCCGLEGLLGAPVAQPAASATDVDEECGAACPEAMMSGTCCMELAGAAAKAEQDACCAHGETASAAAGVDGAEPCCAECATTPAAAPKKIQ